MNCKNCPNKTRPIRRVRAGRPAPSELPQLPDFTWINEPPFRRNVRAVIPWLIACVLLCVVGISLILGLGALK